MAELSIGVLVILSVLSTLLLILWIVLPFIIISMNGKLRDLVRLQREANESLETMRFAMKLQSGRQRRELQGEDYDK